MDDHLSDTILATQDLTRHFGGLKAVEAFNFKVNKGAFHSIIGPNGAGKTTLLNLLSGVLKPTRGRVFYQGKEITSLPSHRMAHLGIGRSYQITNVFPNLSVMENVRLAAQALGKDNLNLFTDFKAFDHYIGQAKAAIERVGLSNLALSPVKSLPHGDKRRLELAMLLAQDPELMLLDEPTAGLASEQVSEFMDMVKEVSEEGDKTVVLVEHNMSVVMSLSDRITVMHQGQLIAEGNPAEISSNEVVQNAYLGDLYEDLGQLADSGADS